MNRTIRVDTDSFAYKVLNLYGLRGGLKPRNLCDLLKDIAISALAILGFELMLIGTPYFWYIYANDYVVPGTSVMLVALTISGMAVFSIIFVLVCVSLLILVSLFMAWIFGLIGTALFKIYKFLDQPVPMPNIKVSKLDRSIENIRAAIAGFKDKYCPIVEYDADE